MELSIKIDKKASGCSNNGFKESDSVLKAIIPLEVKPTNNAQIAKMFQSLTTARIA